MSTQTLNKVTPMMRQYLDVKAQHQDALLFYRMGDFYELFYEDAKIAARDLSITLTSRSKGDDAIPMAGVPVHSADNYLRKLIECGHRVAVCEQVGPVPERGLVDRQVVRVVTAGTLTEEALLNPSQSNWLMAIDQDQNQPDKINLAWADLSTGAFYLKSLPREQAADECVRLQAAELLLCDEELSVLFGDEHQIPISLRPDWLKRPGESARLLKDFFKVSTLEGWALSDNHPALPAAALVLDYLKETQKGQLDHLRPPREELHGQQLMMDRATRLALDLMPQKAQSQSRTLFDVLNHSVTALGARQLRAWIAAPLVNKESIEKRLDAVSYLRDDLDLSESLKSKLQKTYDLERILSRVATGRASPRDLKSLQKTLAELPAVKTSLLDSGSPVLAELVSAPDLCEDLHRLLEKSLTDEPPLHLNQGDVIRSEYDQRLQDTRQLAFDSKTWLAAYQNQLIERTQIPTLKVGYTRVFGYYIEVSRGQAQKVPDDFNRKQTLKNAERYITPELKDFENRILKAKHEISVLEEELFEAIKQEVRSQIPQLQAIADFLGQCDALMSLAVYARETPSCRPRFDDGIGLHIEGGRHPVVEAYLSDAEFVPNDLNLNREGALMMITGPNMSGKSTYIRQTALHVLLAQMGSFVPADQANIPLCDAIFARVGASDDISRGQSTFMVEMSETARILHGATERSLVILDEIGRGTSTYDGVAIAWAVAEYLATHNRSWALFATHYHELTAMADQVPGVINAHVSVKESGDEVVFLRKIVSGGTDKSYGLHVARLAGLPRAVLKRSQNILKDLEQKPGEAIPKTEVSEVQTDLFAPMTSPVLEQLKAIDPNDMTPREALQALFRLKDELDHAPDG